MSATIRINWKPFANGSSSIDALGEFVSGRSLKAAFEGIIDPGVTPEIGKLRKLPVQHARTVARRAIRRLGYSFNYQGI